jgi:CBS domain-containing protein
MKVSQIMRKAMVIDDTIKVKDAAMMMSKSNTGSLIVIKNNKVMGIITERDILKNISELKSKVSKVMTKKVVTINPDAEIDEAKNIMLTNKIKKIPVVDEKKLVGIVTITDILAHSEGVNDDEFIFN